LNGRYGPYVQLGDVSDDNLKPKRQSIPAGTDPQNVTLQDSLNLLSLPNSLWPHPTSEKDIKVGIGRFGPYIVHDGDFRSIPKTESLFEMTFESAVEMLSQPKKGRGRAAPLKEFGTHPDLGETIQLMNGPYGPYLKCGKVNVSLPEGTTVEAVTEAQAIELLREKAGTMPASKKAGAKNTGGKKPAAKPKAGPTTAMKTATKTAAKAAPAKPESKVMKAKASKESLAKSLKVAVSAKQKAEVLGVKKVITRKKSK
jgi:DNA topoisomerase-1